MWFVALVGLRNVKARSVQKKVTKKDREGRVSASAFETTCEATLVGLTDVIGKR